MNERATRECKPARGMDWIAAGPTNSRLLWQFPEFLRRFRRCVGVEVLLKLRFDFLRNTSP